jgi:hypothetical protein
MKKKKIIFLAAPKSWAKAGLVWNPWNLELLWSLDVGVWMFRLPTFVRLCQPMSTTPPPTPRLFDVPCSAFNVQIPSCPHPYQLGRKRIVYFLLSLLPLFPPVQVQINPIMTKSRLKANRSKPKTNQSLSLSSDLVTSFPPAHLDSL